MMTKTRRAAYYFPVNVSGRSKKEIVSDMENTELACFIIESDRGVHLDACRCHKCVQTMLDALVAKTEVATNDLNRKVGPSGGFDSYELSSGAGADETRVQE